MRTNSFKFYISIYTKSPHHKYLGWGAKDLFDAKEFFLSVPFLSEEIILSALSNLEKQENNNSLFPNIVLFLDEKFNKQTADNHFKKKQFKSNKNISLVPVGKTTNNKLVMGGIWKTYETYGLPLDIIFTICYQKNYVPCWLTLYNEMLKSGMKHERIVSKIEEGIKDSLFNKEFTDVVIVRLRALSK